MGETFWKKICDETINFQFVGSGEEEKTSFNRYAEYTCDVGETHLTAYAGGNILRVLQITGKYGGLKAVFLEDSNKVAVIPPALKETTIAYFSQIGLLEKEYGIKTDHFLELLLNGK